MRLDMRVGVDSPTYFAWKAYLPAPPGFGGCNPFLLILRKTLQIAMCCSLVRGQECTLVIGTLLVVFVDLCNDVDAGLRAELNLQLTKSILFMVRVRDLNSRSLRFSAFVCISSMCSSLRLIQ